MPLCIWILYLADHAAVTIYSHPAEAGWAFDYGGICQDFVTPVFYVYDSRLALTVVHGLSLTEQAKAVWAALNLREG
jgi:hypothetical protein